MYKTLEVKLTFNYLFWKWISFIARRLLLWSLKIDKVNIKINQKIKIFVTILLKLKKIIIKFKKIFENLESFVGLILNF